MRSIDHWGRIESKDDVWRTLVAPVLPMVSDGLNAVPLGGLVCR